MITKSITVNKNYRTSNADQYARTTLVHNIDLEEGETKKDATLRAIKELDEIFTIAYPHVEPYLNFHVVRQVNNGYRQPSIHDEQFLNRDTIGTPPIQSQPSTSFIKQDNNVLSTPTIEEPYDIIKEMDSCKSLTVLKIYEKQCKTPEEKQAYENKRKELEQIKFNEDAAKPKKVSKEMAAFINTISRPLI